MASLPGEYRGDEPCPLAITRGEYGEPVTASHLGRRFAADRGRVADCLARFRKLGVCKSTLVKCRKRPSFEVFVVTRAWAQANL